jgi:phosphatidylinositol-3-phosphatase
VIVLENREFDEVVGSEEAPYLNALIERGALATRFYGLLHPSLPNYLALLGGSTFGIADNCTDCLARGPNLVTQMSSAGLPWRAYMGGMPQPCFPGAAAGEYVKRHNPFMYFPSITSRPGLCRRIVPESSLSEDLAARELPEFAWITPGLCDNGHNCPIDASDAYLRQRIPGLLRQLRPTGWIAITYDEGTSDASCCQSAVGGRIVTLLLGPGVRAGVRLPRPYTPYSLLATLEDHFDLPRLRHARDATTMASAFRDDRRQVR